MIPAITAPWPAPLHLLLNDEELRHGIGQFSRQYCGQHYLFEQTARPFLAFAQAPRRTLPQGGGSEFISLFLDFAARQADSAELARYRSGPLSRLKSKLRGRPQ